MPLRRVLATALLALTLTVTTTPAAHAYLWDANQNRIDDRIEAVNTNGLAAAHAGNVLSGRLILFVYPDANPLAYGVYVRYDHKPSRVVPFDESAQQIKQFLGEQKKQQHTEAFIESLKKKSKIEVLV